MYQQSISTFIETIVLHNTLNDLGHSRSVNLNLSLLHVLKVQYSGSSFKVREVMMKSKRKECPTLFLPYDHSIETVTAYLFVRFPRPTTYLSDLVMTDKRDKEEWTEKVTIRYTFGEDLSPR